MADFLTTAERSSLSGDMNTIFDTMSKGRTITVVLEPIQTLVVETSSENVFGFGDTQKEEVYSYTPVSGIFPAMIMYPMEHPSPLNAETNVLLYAGKITIKVQQNCRDYIKTGSVVKILADNKQFDIDGEERRQMFLNDSYYYFDLKATK
jgi:hypothetical protein